jgi:hypothetical protein
MPGDKSGRLVGIVQVSQRLLSLSKGANKSVISRIEGIVIDSPLCRTAGKKVFRTLALLPVFCPLVDEQKKRLSLRPMNTNGLGGGFIHEFRAAQRRRDYKLAGKK